MDKFIIEDVHNNKMYYLSGVSSPQENISAVLTTYTTPTGTKISDNSYVNPKTLSFQLLCSSIAMTSQREFDVNNNTFRDLTQEELKVIIKNWLDNAIKLNITSFESYYENMYLSQIYSTEDTLYMWKPNLTFNEVRQAQPSYVQLAFPINDIEKADGNTEQDMGANNGISAGDVGKVLGSTGSGALLGAAIGSVIPGIGTGVGAVVGAVVGFFGSFIN